MLQRSRLIYSVLVQDDSFFEMFVFCAIAFVFLFFLYDTMKPGKFPPGPSWVPLIGNFSYYRRRHSSLGYHHLVWAELVEKYGPVVGLKMGRNLVVTVSGAEAVKEVLSRDEFDGRPDGFFFRLRTFGKRLGIVFAEGKFWKKQRKFSLQHLKNFGFGRKEMERQIEEETKELVESLKKRCSDPIYMHDAFDVGVVNVLWAMLAGRRFTLDDDRLIKLLKIIHDAFRLTDISGGILNQLPFLRHVAPEASGYLAHVDILRRIKDFLEETINEHRKTVCKTHARDLIDAFLQNINYKKDPDDTFTDEQLLSLCLDLFMAGSETTSNTLSFSMIYMLLHPDVQKKVQQELDEVVGRNRWPNLQDRIKLNYTEAVLMEIQRHANVPPLGVAHRALKTTDLLGYRVPEGTIVLTSLYSIHMDPSYWEEPEKFKPERFFSEKTQEKVNIPEKHFAPFGYGKRRCLGETLAKANFYFFFTGILHNFNVKTVEGDPEPSLLGYDGVTISPKPYRAILEPRVD